MLLVLFFNKEDMTLLGAPVLKGKAQDTAIQDKIDDLTRAVDLLKHLQAHDALVILRKSLAIPKLLYLLRTSQCSNNPLLRQFDDTLRTGLITILNVDNNGVETGAVKERGNDLERREDGLHAATALSTGRRRRDLSTLSSCLCEAVHSPCTYT